jgi:hypothetical protein
MANGIRQTEERLRSHLDSNQVMRERMCLAILPLLGPYTREQPRRPKGGPDGARDLEAIYQGNMPIWGAVGFRNGGGVDREARSWAERKFKSDLDSALAENPVLSGFVFFTNVDLTPGIKDELTKHANTKSVAFIEIFDLERLRHVLDTPEGLLVRLQYLDIPMSQTEQASLIGKYGSQLQNAITARFDRVERTLTEMQRFLDFQKPAFRFDFYFELADPTTSAAIGDEAILLIIQGLQEVPRELYCLFNNGWNSPFASDHNVLCVQVWQRLKELWFVHPLSFSMTETQTMMGSYREMTLYSAGHRARVADVSAISIESICTEGFRSKIRRIAVDINGYEIFTFPADGEGDASPIQWEPNLKYMPSDRMWVNLLSKKYRNMLFEPPQRSSREFSPLQSIQVPENSESS